MLPRAWRPLLPVLGAVAVVILATGGVWAWYAQVEAELREPFDRHAIAFAGSATCRTCHRDHYATWHRTWHRTMTQEASARSVQGRFDGQVIEQWGMPIRPLAEGGAYFF